MIIGDCTEIISGFAFKSKQFNSEGNGTPLVRIRDVGKNNCETFFEGEYKEEYVLNNGDFLVAMDGEFRLAEWSGGKALLNQRVCKIVPKEDKVHDRYLLYMLPKKLKRIEDTTSYVTVKHLSVKKIKNIEIPLPPLETQKKIASILDAADAYRQKTKALIAKYDELTQSLFLDMFGDPVTNPKGWEKSQIDKACSKVTDGTHDTPKRVNGGVKFITGKHIRPYKIDFNSSDFVALEVHQEIFKRCNPEYGDLLYTNIGANVGTAAFNNVKYEFSMKNVALFKPLKSHLNGRFLEFFLNSENMKKEVIRIASLGGAQKFLSLKDLRRLKVALPPIGVQIDFANRIEKMNEQKAQAQESLEKAEELFSSLLQRAFKGGVK